MRSIIIVITILFSGCRKYEEGPLISFRSVVHRIEGNWQVTEYISNGIDSLQYYNDSISCKMEIIFNWVSESTLPSFFTSRFLSIVRI